ncbi:MAG: M28 family peptidase [Promethearchaeota archaeon]
MFPKHKIGTISPYLSIAVILFILNPSIYALADFSADASIFHSIPSPLKATDILPTNLSPTNQIQSFDETHQNLLDGYNSSQAYENIATQLDFGYRIPGTAPSRHCVEWIKDTMDPISDVSVFNFTISKGGEDRVCQNVIAKFNPGYERIVIFASHFDSRAVAEKDPNPELQNSPIDGANDGASGVGVMMEMIEVLSRFGAEISWDREIWFVFFDAEDQGYNRIFGLEDWIWCEGSIHMAEDMETNPESYFTPEQSLSTIDAFILFDMVGGTEMEFIHEHHNSPDLFNQFFTIGNDLGYGSTFPLDAPKFSINDDHVAFANRGVPTLDVIIKFWDTSLDWAHHHTHADNLDNIDQNSLEITGKTALSFLFNTYSTNYSSADGNFTTGSNFWDNWPFFALGGVGIAVTGFFFFCQSKSNTKTRKINGNRRNLKGN